MVRVGPVLLPVAVDDVSKGLVQEFLLLQVLGQTQGTRCEEMILMLSALQMAEGSNVSHWTSDQSAAHDGRHSRACATEAVILL